MPSDLSILFITMKTIILFVGTIVRKRDLFFHVLSSSLPVVPMFFFYRERTRVSIKKLLNLDKSTLRIT